VIDVRRLRVLREVAARGSLSGAADALNYTPSAVSQQIATLEREIGVALVERGPRSITLTDAGRALTEHAELILARLVIAEAEVKEIAGLRGGRLRLGTFRTAGETILARAITSFHERYPDVELTLVEGEPEEYLPRVRLGELDLAMGFEYDHVPRIRIESTEELPLLNEPIGVVLPQHHELASESVVDLTALAADPWVASSPSSSVHSFTRSACVAAGFEPTINFETNDYHVAQALVASGVGVAFLPELAAETVHPDVVYRRALQDPRRRVFAVFRAGGLRSPATAAMVVLLEAECDGVRGRLAA
jgi:DNA-binding transcriptional LysR family regulator